MGTSYDGSLFKKYKENCNIFIETGSYIGDGIQAAINAGFEKIISVELSEIQYNYCVDRFKNNSNVNIYLGDSKNLLKNILIENYKPDDYIFFWLDAHCYGGNTAGKGVIETLPEEIEIIINFTKNNNINAIFALDDISDLIFEKINKLMTKNNILFLSKEECINPYNNTIIKDHQILLYKFESKIN